MANDLWTESLGRWAKRCGISYRTAWRWFRTKRLPDQVVAEQMPTGTILIRDGRIRKTAAALDQAVIYARINPRQDPGLLQKQIDSCRSFCLARGWIVSKIVREVAAGVGAQRHKLVRLVEQRTPRVVVAAPSVLTRFDFRLCELLWKNMDCELVVVDRSEEISGGLEDLTDAINIICHRHYGPKRGTALVEFLGKVIAGRVSV
jgi:putative resolvase